MKEKFITGGHFMIKEGQPLLNEGTIESFRRAVELHKKYFNNSVLGVLINDMGVTCQRVACPIDGRLIKIDKQNFSLPAEYIEILQKNGLQEENIQIFWEKHIRNRAKKFFRRKFKSKFPFILREKTYFYDHPRVDKEIPVSVVNEQDKYGTPTCALIMATFYKELERRGFRENFNFYYTGKDNPNVPDPKILECGYFLADLTKQQIKVENFLFNNF